MIDVFITMTDSLMNASRSFCGQNRSFIKKLFYNDFL